MKRSSAICVAFVAVAFLAAAFGVRAGAPMPHWTAPGWYHMKEGFSPGEYWIYAGPFPTERVCKATLPVKPKERFRCEYYARRPLWDW